MLKLLTRRTIIDCSNEARKYLQTMSAPTASADVSATLVEFSNG